ncbi:NYN domain-containing protein [Nocardioides sp. GCM10027113]|uniref:NYN domain-containing protein n=1 Tax=unclassified Nocardioides TaxID=2615069 RepID=UPI00360843C8
MSGETTGAPGVPLAQLPGAVTARVVALTAEALPGVARLPVPLRKVAEFAPARRARLGASAISAALEDDDFRERVALQVGATQATPPADLAAAPDDADPVELAALAWLLRPEGWESLLEASVERLVASSTSAPDAEVERWRSRAETAERALRDARTRHREGLADLKAENASLRRKLGEARSVLRESAVTAEDLDVRVAEARAEVESALADRDREVRQLRAQLERLQAEAQQARRSARADREEVTIRARLLLDTLVEAAGGLRRELSLPAVPGAPADRVEAELERADTAGGAGDRTILSPAMLEQTLALPRARLVVDGYNVSKTAFPSASLEAQRNRLVNGLAPLVARTGADTTVIFDAAATTTARPVVAAPRGVRVRFSPEGVIADDVIRDLVAAEPEGRVLVVVTTDAALGRDVARAGARVVPASVLADLLAGG